MPYRILGGLYNGRRGLSTCHNQLDRQIPAPRILYFIIKDKIDLVSQRLSQGWFISSLCYEDRYFKGF